MKQNKKIDEKGLDELLAREFLKIDLTKPANKKMANAVGKSVMLSKPSLFSGFSLMMVIAGAAAIVLSASLPFTEKNVFAESSVISISNTKYISPEEKSCTDTSEEKFIVPVTVRDRGVISFEPAADTFLKEPFVFVEERKENSDELIPAEYEKTTNVEEEEMERLPVLTEKEIKANEKEKRKMAKLAARLDQKKYAVIKLSSSLNASNRYKAGSYWMQTAEVTNLEYRTFLFDLLIQGKTDEFLKARPKQKTWLNSNGTNKFDFLKDEYFSNKKYDFYPVVNISKQGAEMYCAWLADIAKEYVKIKNSVPLELTVRLPYEDEWIHAANAGNIGASYPWLYDSVQNKHNRFLANFCIQKLKHRLNEPLAYPGGQNPDAWTSGGMALNNDSIASVLVYAYNPNNFGLYCISGNVSELVYENSSTSVKTKGGNWNSDFEHLRIDGDDEFKNNVKPSPMIGFRVVMLLK